MEAENNPLNKYPSLKGKFDFLKSQQDYHENLYIEIISTNGNNVVLIDHFVIGILKRSLDLVNSFIILINNWHFTVSATILRMQIDNLIRIFYSTKRSDKEFYMEFYKGKSFRELKHIDGKPLIDSLLIKISKDTYPWIEDVYRETSKYLHLSNKHFNTTITSIGDNKMTNFFGIGQPNCREEDLSNLLDAFSCTTDAIIKIVQGWIITKNSYNNN
ncbi:MAG: hypothetical protein EHM58_11740 [Ignavibacteriae bacterium]|nr:MAG: hypothetical protein EHM58_11740 [Ignavibacteriota bacterium]